METGITAGDYLSGFLQGTRQALYENQRDSITVTIPEVTPHQVGALIALYERAVSLYACLININAYHQPGVEAGKKAAATILDLQTQVMAALKATRGPISLGDLAARAQASDQVETLYRILRHLEANDRGVQFHGDRDRPGHLTITYHP